MQKTIIFHELKFWIISGKIAILTIQSNMYLGGGGGGVNEGINRESTKDEAFSVHYKVTSGRQMQLICKQSRFRHAN